MQNSVVGKSPPMIHTLEKATGTAKYVNDMVFPGMLWGRILRSRYPHARILRIDITRAEKLAGVKAVATGRNTPGHRYGAFVHDQVIFAQEKARYIGDPVAAVAAVDEDTAEEALGLIEVEYEELPAVFDPIEAMTEGAPLVHEELDNYTSVFPVEKYGNVCIHASVERGDVQAGFQEADLVLEDSFRTPMVHQAYLEPHGVIADVSATGKVTVWTPTQSVFMAQGRIADAFGLPLTKVRVIVTCLGGGFGGKVETLVEPIAVALAQKTRGPVKIILTREEEFIAAKPRHPAVVNFKIGAKKDGTMAALEARLVYDTGAFADDGPMVASVGTFYASQPYRIPNVKIDGYAVYTNHALCGAFRGFGNPQQAYGFESMMDMIAERLGIDPLELRLKNALQGGDSIVIGQTVNSVGLKECLSKSARGIGWRSDEPGVNRGRGLASLWHTSANLFTQAVVKMQQDGTVVLSTGASDIGQGSDTVLCQIVAETLGLPIEDVAVSTPDTDTSPYNWATVASRTTYVVGNAARLAAIDAKTKMFELAAEELEVASHLLEIADRHVCVPGASGRSMSLREVALKAHWRKGGPIMGVASFGMEGPGYDPEVCKLTGAVLRRRGGFVFGSHAVEVEVATSTGQVRVTKIAAAHDVGRAVNPRGVEGQIQGGFVMGLGYALYEEIRYQDGRVLNPTFLDYKIPTMLDVPDIEAIIVEEPDEGGPFGAKGVGEPGLLGVAPAVANAIYNAVGVRIKELPITAEKLYWALKEKGKH